MTNREQTARKETQDETCPRRVPTARSRPGMYGGPRHRALVAWLVSQRGAREGGFRVWLSSLGIRTPLVPDAWLLESQEKRVSLFEVIVSNGIHVAKRNWYGILLDNLRLMGWTASVFTVMRRGLIKEFRP